MAVEVAVFTPRAPVNLFESAQESLGTTFSPILRPTLYAEVDGQNTVQRLLSTVAVATRLTVSNTSVSARTVDFRVLSSRKITYSADLVALSGTNSLRLDRDTTSRGPALFGYDWTQVPPVRLTDEPVPENDIYRDVSWHPNSRYVAVVRTSQFEICDRDAAFARIYLSPVLADPAGIDRCVWSPDGRYLAVSYVFADLAGVPFLRVFDFNTITAPVEVTLPDLSISVTTALRDIVWGGPAGTSATSGRYLIVAVPGTGAGSIVVWDWDSGAPVLAPTLAASIRAAVTGQVRGLRFSRGTTSARLAITHSTGDLLTVLDWPTATTVSKLENSLFAANTTTLVGSRRMAWSFDNRYLACLSGSDAAVLFTIYDLQSGVAVLPSHAPLPPLPPLSAVDWSADGETLVIGHTEAERATYYPLALPYLLQFDLQTGTPVRITTEPNLQGFGAVRAVAFSPDGEVLMASGRSFDLFYPPTGVDNVQLLDGSGNDVVVNGSFENVTGLDPEPFGYSSLATLPGWFADDGGVPAPNRRIFLLNQRFVDAFATDGRVYLDLNSEDDSAPQGNDVRLRQDFAGLVSGDTYRLNIDVTSSLESNTKLRVQWNGVDVSIDGTTVLPIIETRTILSVAVPAGETVSVPLERFMLAYGDSFEAKANGAGVDCVLSYVLSTQEPPAGAS